MTLEKTVDTDYLELWWLPVGAGTDLSSRIVARCSRLWERIQAARERRPQGPLFHAALVVCCEGQRSLVEMTPAWGQVRRQRRQVVATGPVGTELLGRSRFFRYQISREPNGIILDRSYAPAPPTQLPVTTETAAALLDLAAQIPRFTWGRTPRGSTEMWNSNSAISYLLARGGVAIDDLVPPRSGKAPGWNSGLEQASHRRGGSRCRFD